MAQAQEKKQRRPAHQTQWAAQFAVASKLCKRGYEVALTLGNHPNLDLMVISPHGVQFIVDVKGLYTRNFWPVRKKKRRDKLFYVFAFAPPNSEDRFFVLTQAQVNEGIADDWKHAVERRKLKHLVGLPGDFTGVQWKFAEDFEDEWKALPK